jgi:hypothetical protein
MKMRRRHLLLDPEQEQININPPIIPPPTFRPTTFPCKISQFISQSNMTVHSIDISNLIAFQFREDSLNLSGLPTEGSKRLDMFLCRTMIFQKPIRMNVKNHTDTTYSVLLKLFYSGASSWRRLPFSSYWSWTLNYMYTHTDFGTRRQFSYSTGLGLIELICTLWDDTNNSKLFDLFSVIFLKLCG